MAIAICAAALVLVGLLVEQPLGRQVLRQSPRPSVEARPHSTVSTEPATHRGQDCRSRLPDTPTTFGTSLSTSHQTIEEALRGERAKFGPLPVVRVFDPGLPPPDAWSRRGRVLSGVDTVTSFRAAPAAVLSGAHDRRLRRFFTSAPHTRDIYWSFNHEPEPEIAAGEYTAREYRAAWRHIAFLADSVCNRRLHATLILTGFTTNPISRRDWRDYYPGGRVVDVLAWDIYNGALRRASQYQDPAIVFGPAAIISSEAGKPFAITEMGTVETPDDPSGLGRARWLARSGAYLASQNAVFVTYFDSLRDGAFLLSDQPSIAAWRRLVTGQGDVPSPEGPSPG